MPNSGSAAWAADTPLLPTKLGGRALNTVGVAFAAISATLFASATLPAMERTSVGLLFAAVMLAVGEFMSHRSKSAGYWFATSLCAAAYGTAAFFAHATYYVAGLSTLSSPELCWGLELGLGLIVTVHASRNHWLRWFSVPFTLLATADVLFHSLSSDGTYTVAGMTFKVAAAASVISVIYLAALSAIYKQLEQRFSDDKQVFAVASRWMYRVAHEGYFLFTACSALALPKFCGSMDYAPVWWALETPILLAICWRSNSFFKHALVMTIWGLSAALLLVNKMELDPIVRMAVPLSGFAMAMAYRYLQSSWQHWQKLTGYAVYLYGAVVVALVVPFFQLGVKEALPYFLVESALLVGLAFALSDRLLQRAAALVGLAALGLFAARWQEWTVPFTSMVVIGSYSASLLYGYIKSKGGWANSDFSVARGEQSLSAKEAGWLEIGSGVAGYLTLLGGSYLLIANPFNTISWGVEAFVLIAFGFLTGKVGHRFSGLVALTLASAKLTIIDLSGAGSLMRTLVSFGAVGICCIAASIFYTVEYGRKHKRAQDDTPPNAG